MNDGFNNVKISVVSSLLAMMLGGCVIMPPDGYVYNPNDPNPTDYSRYSNNSTGGTFAPAKVWTLRVDNAKQYCPPYHIRWSAIPLSEPFGQGTCEPSLYTYDGNIIPAKYLNVSFRDEIGNEIVMSFNVEQLTVKAPLVYSSIIVDFNQTAHIVSLIYKTNPNVPQYAVPGGNNYSPIQALPVVLAQQSY